MHHTAVTLQEYGVPVYRLDINDPKFTHFDFRDHKDVVRLAYEPIIRFLYLKGFGANQTNSYE